MKKNEMISQLGNSVMKKSDMISQLKDRIVYCEEQKGYYEKLHGEEVAKGESNDHTVWSEMCDWYKGKLNAYNVALDMAKELA